MHVFGEFTQLAKEWPTLNPWLESITQIYLLSQLFAKFQSHIWYLDQQFIEHLPCKSPYVFGQSTDSAFTEYLLCSRPALNTEIQN